MICDKSISKVSVNMKGKLYKTVVRTALLYCLVDTEEKQETELVVAEYKMLNFALGLMSIGTDFIRSEGQHS